MQTVRITLPKYHPNQAGIHRELNRFNVLDCARRYGKDIMQRNYVSEGLLQGDACAWYEPTYKTLIENWYWFCDTYAPIIKRKHEQEKRLDLINGSSLEMWSLDDKDASRGRHYKRLAINEAAKVPHLEYSWNNVIRITLADLQGEAMIGSTPRGMNYFYNLYNHGADPLMADWSSWKRTTYDNPYIARGEIAELKKTLPEITFRQEILAEFISSDGSVFRRVMEVATLDPLDKPQPGRQYSAGVDVASSVDYTVITVFDVASREMVFMDRFNRVDYPVLEDRLEATYKAWGLTGMVVEANSIGRPVIDHLAEKGLGVTAFTTTNTTKDLIIKDVMSAFEHDTIKVLNDPVLIGELLSFESKRTAAGNFTYSAPEGLHDDCVMSLALALYGISGVGWLVS